MEENVIENRVVKPSAKLKYPESLRRFVHPDLAFAAIFLRRCSSMRWSTTS